MTRSRSSSLTHTNINSSSDSSLTSNITITTRSTLRNSIVGIELKDGNQQTIIKPRLSSRRSKVNSILTSGLKKKDSRVKLDEFKPNLSNHNASTSELTTSRIPLPSLLSHLSLTNHFPTSTDTTAFKLTTSTSTNNTSHSSSQFNFPPPPLLSPPQQSYSQSYTQNLYYLPIPLLSSNLNHEKRPSNILGPPPHLLSRTKKRKLLHRFFRSEAILAGPSPSSSNLNSNSNSPNVSPPPLSPPPPPSTTTTSHGPIKDSTTNNPENSISSPTSPPPFNFIPSLSPSLSSPSYSSPPTVYQPIHPRQPPSWWASISRDATESKMIPEEGSWVGNGCGWNQVDELLLDYRRDRFSRNRGRGKGWKGKGKGREMDCEMLEGEMGEGEEEEEEEEEEMMDAELALEYEKDRRSSSSSASGSTTSSKWNIRDRLGWTNHHAVPVGAGGIGNGGGGGGTNAAPLKQHLLAVLRMRLREGGASSKGGEAGLRFKKWVVWNSWMKKSTSPQATPATGNSILSDDSSMEEVEAEKEVKKIEVGEPSTVTEVGGMRIKLKRSLSSTTLTTTSTPNSLESDQDQSLTLVQEWEDSALFSEGDVQFESTTTGEALLSPTSTCSTTPESNHLNLNMMEIEEIELEEEVQLPQSPRQSNRILPNSISSSSEIKNLSSSSPSTSKNRILDQLNAIPSTSTSTSNQEVIIPVVLSTTTSTHQYSINSRPRRGLTSSTPFSSSSLDCSISSPSSGARPSLKRRQSLPTLNKDTIEIGIVPSRSRSRKNNSTSSSSSSSSPGAGAGNVPGGGNKTTNNVRGVEV